MGVWREDVNDVTPGKDKCSSKSTTYSSGWMRPSRMTAKMSSNRDPESDHFGKASDHCLDTCGRRADLGWLAGRAIRRSASRHTCNCGEAERLRTAKSLGQHDHPIFCAEGALHALCRFRPAVEVVRGWVSVW